MILSVISFALGTVAYTISQLAQHGKLRWSGKDFSFWGKHSDKRKYKYFDDGEKEPAFFLSTTLLVFLTDGYHLAQFIFKLFLIISLVTYEPIFNLKVWDFILYFLLFGLTFTATYKLLSK